MRSKIMALVFILFALPAYAVNWTFTDNVTINGTLTVTGVPTFTDNTINGADLIDNTLSGTKVTDNTIALGKIVASGTKDNTTFLRGDGAWTPIYRGATAYTNSNVVVDNTTAKIIPWDRESIDTSSIHTITGTDNTKFVVPSGVTKVKLGVFLVWDAGVTSGTRYVGLLKNGLTFGNAPFSTVSPYAALYVTQTLWTPALIVSEGDYFEVQVTQTSSGGNTAVIGAADGSWFYMEILE